MVRRLGVGITFLFVLTVRALGTCSWDLAVCFVVVHCLSLIFSVVKGRQLLSLNDTSALYKVLMILCCAGLGRMSIASAPFCHILLLPIITGRVEAQNEPKLVQVWALSIS